MALTRKKRILLVSVYMLPFLVESQQNFAYFVLSLRWPNAFCNQGKVICREPVPQDFKISAFMPRTNTGKLPTFINPQIFNHREVKNWNFTKDLELLWPSVVVDRKNTKVWSLGWRYGGKHTDMTAEDYFYTATQYTKKYINIYELLRRSDKNFPSSQSYDREELYRIIENILGFMPRVVCNRNFNGEPQLSSISICMNRRGEAFDCHSQFFHCPMLGPIYFPTEETVIRM